MGDRLVNFNDYIFNRAVRGAELLHLSACLRMAVPLLVLHKHCAGIRSRLKLATNGVEHQSVLDIEPYARYGARNLSLDDYDKRPVLCQFRRHSLRTQEEQP